MSPKVHQLLHSQPVGKNPLFNMSSRNLTIAVLLLAACLCFQASAVNNRFARKKLSCCTRVHPSDISHDVTGNTYREQHSNLHCVAAIIFSTRDGTVCVDPRSAWVRKLTAKMTKV